MARRLLSDIAVCKEILDGLYDSDLHAIEQAVKHRRKVQQRESGFVKGARVRVKDIPEAGDLGGLYAKVDKVNAKTVSITLERSDWESYRVTPGLIEKA